jgi:hypothetical protein
MTMPASACGPGSTAVAWRRRGAIAICAVMLATPGCALLFGKHHPVDECEPKKVSSSQDVEKAPAWVPGSPTGTNMPKTGCVGGDGSHHLDRLCVVAKVEGMTSIAQSDTVARERSLRQLSDELRIRLVRVLGPTTSSDDAGALAKRLRDVIGRVTGTWRAPSCTTYAIAEMTLADFTFVVHGPELSKDARKRLLADAGEVVGTP